MPVPASPVPSIVVYKYPLQALEMSLVGITQHHKRIHSYRIRAQSWVQQATTAVSHFGRKEQMDGSRF